MQIILLLKLKWNIEDLDDGTSDYKLKILLPGSIVNVRNNLLYEDYLHRINLLHVGTTNYNRLAGLVFLKTNVTARRITEPSNFNWLLLNV